MKNFLAVSQKSIKRTRPKSGIARFVTLKDCNNNSVHLIEATEEIMTNPDKASEKAIVKFQRSFGLRFDQRLFTVASYPMGHFLIYDNHSVMAYTTIRL